MAPHTTTKAFLSALLASTVLSSPISVNPPLLKSWFPCLTKELTLTYDNFILERDCSGQHIFHMGNPGEAAANKQGWVNLGFTDTDLAIIMKEDAGRNSVEADEDGAPGHYAFTIFNLNWWMVKKSCPQFTPPGLDITTNEDQIPSDIFLKLNADQGAALQCIHQSMNDPYYNKPGDPPTSNIAPSPAWWAVQRGGPGAAQPYLAGAPLDPVVIDYMWNTVGIQQWITNGAHQTDDWIESSCLTGLTGPAPCPVEFPNCGAGML